MTKANLKNQIAEAASAFSLSIVEAVKAASLQELMELQTSGIAKKPARKKPGPKPSKPAAKKPGRKPKAVKTVKTVKTVKAIKAKPGPKKGIKKAKPGPKKVVKKVKMAEKPKRVTKKDKSTLLENIIAYVKKNPWSPAGAICKQFKLNPWTARRHMQQLQKAGKIEIKGEKAKTRYAVK